MCNNVEPYQTMISVERARSNDSLNDRPCVATPPIPTISATKRFVGEITRRSLAKTTFPKGLGRLRIRRQNSGGPGAQVREKEKGSKNTQL